MKHFDVTYKSNTISAILRYAEEYVEILCSNKRVQLNLPSIVQDVEINDSQPKLETCEDDSACISWSENETV